MADDTKVTTIYDTNLDGYSDSSGSLSQSYDRKALINALKMWVASFRGDYVGKPEKGGVVTSRLMKPMGTVDVAGLKHAIRDGLDDDFSVPLRINKLQVIPDYENRKWLIYLDVFSPELNINAVVNEYAQGR